MWKIIYLRLYSQGNAMPSCSGCAIGTSYIAPSQLNAFMVGHQCTSGLEGTCFINTLKYILLPKKALCGILELLSL